jgi:hypothetical protein
MNARTKAFLARFAFCLALLLILTGIYYWQQFRTANSAVNAEAQKSLSVLSGSLDHRLSEAELSLQRFAASAPLRNFIKTAGAETEAKALDQNASGFGLPGDLYQDLVVLLKASEHFTSLALFNEKGQSRFKLERQPNGACSDLLLFP